MKKSVVLALLLLCGTTLFATKKTVPKKTSIKIALVKFYSDIPNTKELADKFFKETIKPLTPYWLFQNYYDPHAKKRDIYQTLYRIAHPDASPVKDSVFGYPQTINFLCQRDFFDSLTSDGKDVYLSVLAEYATTLSGTIEYGNQINYAFENIPLKKRLGMWRILARKIKFTKAFLDTTDSEKIKNIFDYTLFSILCKDKEEAALLRKSKNLPVGPIKIYLETVLLNRPTDLEMLTQALYQLSTGMPPRTPEQAAATLTLTWRTEDGVIKKNKEEKKERPEEYKASEKNEKQDEKKEIKSDVASSPNPPKEPIMKEEVKKPEEKKVEEKKVEEKEIKYFGPPLPEELKFVTLEETKKQMEQDGKRPKEEIKKTEKTGEPTEFIKQPKEQVSTERVEGSSQISNNNLEITELMEKPEEPIAIETIEYPSKSPEELKKEREETEKIRDEATEQAVKEIGGYI